MDDAAVLGWREGVIQQIADQFVDYDLLLSPTMGVTAFPVDGYPMVMDDEESYANPGWNYRALTHPINTAGLPAASVPCGFDADGMPVGLQIVGPLHGDALVLRASGAFEAAVAHPYPHPVLFERSGSVSV